MSAGGEEKASCRASCRAPRRPRRRVRAAARLPARRAQPRAARGHVRGTRTAGTEFLRPLRALVAARSARSALAPVVPQWSQGPPGREGAGARPVEPPLCASSSTLSAGERASRACCGVSRPASASASASVAAVGAPASSRRTRQYQRRPLSLLLPPGLPGAAAHASASRLPPHAPAPAATTPGPMAAAAARRAQAQARNVAERREKDPLAPSQSICAIGSRGLRKLMRRAPFCVRTLAARACAQQRKAGHTASVKQRALPPQCTLAPFRIRHRWFSRCALALALSCAAWLLSCLLCCLLTSRAAPPLR
jgi:hypothetical protein